MTSCCSNNNSNSSKECTVCNSWCFNHGFKFQIFVCNGCSDISVIAAEGVGYRCIIHDIRKPEVIHLLENSVLDCHKMICIKEIDIKNRVYHYYFDN